MDDAKLAGLGAPIPAAKLRGLREALAERHVVRFNNGSEVEYEDCVACEGTGEKDPIKRHEAIITEAKTCPTCGGEKVRLLVTREAGGVARFRLDTELSSAYAMALRGPQPRAQPSGDSASYGDETPW